MSLRVRVLLLVVLVAVSATAATAWLTLRQASQQLTESVTADQTQLAWVVSQLEDYGRRHGTWEGVVHTVVELGTRSGQRIHLVAEGGTVIADTDTERAPDRAARPLGSTMGFVNPRAQLDLAGTTGKAAAALTVKMILAYRADVLRSSCLTRRGVDPPAAPAVYGPGTATAAPVPDDSRPDDGRPDDGRRSAAPGSGGVPSNANMPGEPAISWQCAVDAAEVTQDQAAHRDRVARCNDPDRTTEVGVCLAQAFAEQTGDVAPAPARVFLGAGGVPARPLAAGPLLAAAAGVAAVAVLGTAALSHRVLRPVSRLTAAAQRLGRGDLTSRVPVDGRDELAELARSFNRMADSLQRGEERQRRLVADVAHELRTPLANLRGYLEALSDGVVTPDPELFASLHEEAVLQQRIVDDLQDLALAEAGHLAYHRGAVDLADLLETCRISHHARAEAAGVALAVDAHPVTVIADPDRLRQVLGNLITNALRATSPGGTVTLTARRAAGSAVVRVADTGTGIAPEALPYVFDRFWRADSARGRRTGGSGLGLAIVRQIVTDHAGTVAVASEPGAGSTFTITLPAADRPG